MKSFLHYGNDVERNKKEANCLSVETPYKLTVQISVAPGPRNSYRVAPFSVFLRKCSKYRSKCTGKSKSVVRPTTVSLVRPRFCCKEQARLGARFWRGSTLISKQADSLKVS